jgi:hypothetical protein
VGRDRQGGGHHGGELNLPRDIGAVTLRCSVGEAD